MKPIVSGISCWTPKTSLKRIRNDCSCHCRAIRIDRIATTPEEIKNRAHFKKRIVAICTDCHTLGTGVRAEWFGSSWRPTSKPSEPINHWNPEKPKPRCHHCEKPRQFKKMLSAETKNRKATADTTNGSRTTTVPPLTVTPTPITTHAKTTRKLTKNLKLSTRPLRHVAKRTNWQRDFFLQPMQQRDSLPRTEDRQV